MANSETLPIYIETYRLVQEVFRCTVKFSKEYKFVLGTSLNENVLNLCCTIFQANHSSQKTQHLNLFLANLEKVRLQLRLCADFNLISCKQQAHFAQMIEKISFQAVAWQRSERSKEKKTQ